MRCVVVSSSAGYLPAMTFIQVLIFAAVSSLKRHKNVLKFNCVINILCHIPTMNLNG